MLSVVRESVSDSTFDIWIAPLRCARIDGSQVVIRAPAEIGSWVQGRFGALLTRAARVALGEDAVIEVEAGAVAGTGTAAAAGRRPAQTPSSPRPHDTREQSLRWEPIDPNPELSFSQFVIGDSNRLAHAAALTVAEMPGQAYNPLFIYGPPGMGKTHLLHAIANYATAFSPELRVTYVTGEAFTNAFLSSLQAGSVDEFKARFRHNDLMLFDDVQFLQRKTRTEEEFFHTFNALHAAGAQVVVTSDRLPKDLAGLEARLRERFEAGLVCDIKEPEAGTRLAILNKRARDGRLGDIDPACVELIATRVLTNVRALEGALTRVAAYASLTGRPVDRDLTLQILDGLYASVGNPPSTITAIQDAICEEFAITRTELLGASRAARVVWPRQVGMYLSRELTKQSLPAIGRAFGGRDHTTVMHAHRKASQRLERDSSAGETIHRLSRRLAQHGS